MNDDGVEPLMLGSIASQYYLRYMTVSMFGSNIGPDTSLEVMTALLDILLSFMIILCVYITLYKMFLS